MKVLVTGAFGQIETLRERFPEVTFDFWQNEKESVPNPDAYEGVICNALLTLQDATAFSNLRFVQLTAAGYDRVPMQVLNGCGVRVYNAGDAYAIPMAEAAAWGVLTLYRKGKALLASAQCHAWEKQSGLREMYAKRVCIVGCGNYGRACARLFSAFGCFVTGVNRNGETMPGFDEIFDIALLKVALEHADIVVCALPLTNQTCGLFDSEVLAACKHGALLVNLSRGKIVCEQDMISALQSGRLGGAVLDVFAAEPLDKESPLWEMEQVIITPHNAYAGDGTAKRLLDVVCRNLEGELL